MLLQVNYTEGKCPFKSALLSIGFKDPYISHDRIFTATGDFKLDKNLSEVLYYLDTKQNDRAEKLFPITLYMERI